MSISEIISFGLATVIIIGSVLAGASFMLNRIKTDLRRLDNQISNQERREA